MAINKSRFCLLVATLFAVLTTQSSASIVNIFSKNASGKTYAEWDVTNSVFDGTTLTVEWKVSVPQESPYTLYDARTYLIDVSVLTSDPLGFGFAQYIGGGQWKYGDLIGTLSGASGIGSLDQDWKYIYTFTHQWSKPYPYVSLGDLAPGEEASGDVKLTWSTPNNFVWINFSSDDFATIPEPTAPDPPAMPEPSALAVWLLMGVIGLAWRARRRSGL